MEFHVTDTPTSTSITIYGNEVLGAFAVSSGIQDQIDALKKQIAALITQEIALLQKQIDEIPTATN